jgi:hypothetical protein
VWSWKYVQQFGDHSTDDVGGCLPADPQQPAGLRLAHLLHQPSHTARSSKSRVSRAPSRALHHLWTSTAARALQPPDSPLDLAAHPADIQMPPSA